MDFFTKFNFLYSFSLFLKISRFGLFIYTKYVIIILSVPILPYYHSYIYTYIYIYILLQSNKSKWQPIQPPKAPKNNPQYYLH